ncbi:alanine racemase, partial [Rothia kristinae]
MSKPEQRPDPSADPDSSSTLPTADSAQLPPERAALIDLGAVEHNVRVLRRRCAPARLIAVVKADAYGHGAVPVARAALRAGAD